MKKTIITILKIGTGLIALLGVVLAITFIMWRPKDRLKEGPEATFRRLVVDPIPASVRNLKVEGYDTQYQAQVTLTFSVEPSDLSQLLEHRPYQKGASSENGWRTFKASDRGGLNTYDLSINDQEKKAQFTYWSS